MEGKIIECREMKKRFRFIEIAFIQLSSPRKRESKIKQWIPYYEGMTNATILQATIFSFAKMLM